MNRQDLLRVFISIFVQKLTELGGIMQDPSTLLTHDFTQLHSIDMEPIARGKDLSIERIAERSTHGRELSRITDKDELSLIRRPDIGQEVIKKIARAKGRHLTRIP